MSLAAKIGHILDNPYIVIRHLNWMGLQETFQCSVCFKIFSNIEELRYHYKIMHKVNELKPI